MAPVYQLVRSAALCLISAAAGLYAGGGCCAAQIASQPTARPAPQPHVRSHVQSYVQFSAPAAKPRVAALSPTTTALELCVGPTPMCPSTGYVAPPFQANLPMIYGQTYNGTAVVTPADGGALGGQTLFYDTYNGTQTLLCTLTTASGSVCQSSVGSGAQVGTHVFTDVYMGDTTHTGSSSPPVTIVVAPDTTTAALAGAPGTALVGQPVTLTATVTGNFAAPTGTISFVESPAVGSNPLVLGTGVLTPGTGLSSTASLTTTALPMGSDTVGVNYSGTLNFAAASSTLLLTVRPSPPGSFTLAVSPTATSVSVGSSARLMVTVTPKSDSAQGVNLSCSNLPAEATCLFDTSTMGAGGGTTHLVVATTAPHSCGSGQPSLLGWNGGGPGPGMGASLGPAVALPAVAGLALLFMPGRRRWLRALVTMIVVAAAVGITGCATCADLGTRPATYTFQVTGTAADSTSSVTQPVTITVTM